MRTSCLFALLVASMTYGLPASAQQFGATVTINEAAQSDQYVAGRIVRINAAIDGDLVVAGQRLIVDAGVTGDLIAAGESVDVRDAVGDDVRAAGRTVSLAGPVSGHVVAAGETVTIAQGSSVAEWAWLAGRSVSVDGNIGQELRAAGENVSVNGRVAGDANLIGEQIEVGPAAFIGGDLILQSGAEPEIAASATIAGEVIREDLPEDFDGIGPLGVLGGIAGFIYFTATVITAVLVLGLLFPRFSTATSERLAATPLRVLGAGLLAIVGIPVVMILVFMTGIGLIVGLGLLGIYLLGLLLGGLLGIIAVGHLGLNLAMKERAPTWSTRALALALGTAALLVVVQIPLLGGLIALLLTIAGIGTATGELWARYRQAA